MVRGSGWLSSLTNRKELEPGLIALRSAGRVGQEEEVMKADLRLASRNASFVHGALLTFDGGWRTRSPKRKHSNLILKAK